jgi:hypothetical protein
VILRDEAKLQLAKIEEKLKATKEELKTQGQSLESAWQALSRHEISSNTVITSAVAHAAVLFKNHLPDLDVEILCKDIIVDDTVLETLVASTYDAAHDFVYHMILPVSLSLKTMIVPGTSDSSLYVVLNIY